MKQGNLIKRPGRRRMTGLGSVTLLALLVAGALGYFIFAGSASAASATLVPSADRSNPGGWTNNSSSSCLSSGTTCSSTIDEDITTPDDGDFIVDPANSQNKNVYFDLSQAPSDTGTASQLVVRYRAAKTTSQSGSVLVEVLNSSNQVIGFPSSQTLTTTMTTYSYTLSGLSLTQAQVNGLYLHIRGDTTGVGTGQIAVSDVNIDVTYEAVAPNPTLSASCGLDMVIVIDRSGSIDSSEMSSMKSALNGFVDALLPATPTQIAVVQFGTTSQVAQGFTGDASTLHTAINGVPLGPGEYTNWAYGLYNARNLFPEPGQS